MLFDKMLHPAVLFPIYTGLEASREPMGAITARAPLPLPAFLDLQYNQQEHTSVLGQPSPFHFLNCSFSTPWPAPSLLQQLTLLIHFIHLSLHHKPLVAARPGELG